MRLYSGPCARSAVGYFIRSTQRSKQPFVAALCKAVDPRESTMDILTARTRLLHRTLLQSTHGHRSGDYTDIRTFMHACMHTYIYLHT